MSDERIYISRRRLLGGIATVGGASVAAGAGTMAAFSDTESSSDNTVKAGILELKVGGTGSTNTFLDVSGIVPSESGNQQILLENNGTIDGDLEIDVVAVRDYERGITNNEKSRDSSTGPGEGELQKYVDIRAFLDGTEDDGTTEDGEKVVSWTGLDTIQSQTLPITYSTGQTIPAKEARKFGVQWRFNDPGDKSVNEAQSDSVEIDIAFRLVQGGG